MKVETLFDNEWVSVKMVDGWYVFTTESRTQDSSLVAVVPFTLKEERAFGGKTIDKILGRYERNPAHDDGMPLVCITGGVDHGDTPPEAAVAELWEEGGFALEEKDLIELGTMRPLASSDATVYLYAVDVTGLEDIRNENPEGDGTIGEQDAYCDWIIEDDAVNCKSANMMAALLRLKYYLDEEAISKR